jgi:hypothetical protein
LYQPGGGIEKREMLKKSERMMFEPIMNVEFEVLDECIEDIVVDLLSNRRDLFLISGKVGHRQ